MVVEQKRDFKLISQVCWGWKYN